MSLRVAGIILLMTIAACAADSSDHRPARFGLGTRATAEDIAARDVDVAPDGTGLPRGHGSVSDGERLYRERCAACHGTRGEGGGGGEYPALIGRAPAGEGFPFGRVPGLTRTIGNYWPYATTVFDYIRRAMPRNAPGSLSNDEAYALTAYLLAANGVISPDAILDSASLVAVRMPYADRFVPDDRRGGRAIK
jgi:cytochrome c